MKQRKKRLYMSDLEFKPIHEFCRVTISSIKYTKSTNSDIFSLHLYNTSQTKITLPLGLLREIAFRVNNILKLIDL